MILLHYVSNFESRKLRPPVDQILDPHLNDPIPSKLRSEWITLLLQDCQLTAALSFWLPLDALPVPTFILTRLYSHIYRCKLQLTTDHNLVWVNVEIIFIYEKQYSVQKNWPDIFQHWQPNQLVHSCESVMAHVQNRHCIVRIQFKALTTLPMTISSYLLEFMSFWDKNWKSKMTDQERH